MALLRRDLQSLGWTEAEVDAIPPYVGWCPRTRAEALGALYVMEGSTLGGKVIGKALRRLPNWPISAPSYFDPYGSATGSMWSAFQDYLDSALEADADAVIVGAQRTFALLQEGMSAEENL